MIVGAVGTSLCLDLRFDLSGALNSTMPGLLNQVGPFFTDLTEKPIRWSVHRSTNKLEPRITEYIETAHETSKSFQWNKTAYKILPFTKRSCLSIREAAATAAS